MLNFRADQYGISHTLLLIYTTFQLGKPTMIWSCLFAIHINETVCHVTLQYINVSAYNQQPVKDVN